MIHIRRSHATIGRYSRKSGQSLLFLLQAPGLCLRRRSRHSNSNILIIQTDPLHPNRWINSLPAQFEQCGLEVLDYVTQAPLPVYRKPWNEDCLIGWAAIGDLIKNQEDKKWYRERLAEAAENAKKGWYVDWELVVCVGRKDG